MDIIKATLFDTDSIMGIMKNCVADMHSKGLFQWNDEYPNITVVEADIKAGSAYVIKSENICVATITLNEEQPPEYKEINWLDSEGKPLIVHRLAIQPFYQNKGLAKRLMTFAEQFSIQHGYSSIRVDTFSANPIALSLYERLGYLRTGQVYFPNRVIPFVCLEKLITTKNPQ